MIFGEQISFFLIRWLTIISMITLIVLSPFLIKRIQPDRYQGFWKAFGDVQRSPKRALMLPLGMLVGLALVIGASLVWELFQ